MNSGSTKKQPAIEQLPSEEPIQSAPIRLQYDRLEQRRVLNADFGLFGSVLDIDNFSQLVDEGLSISDNGTDIQFQLDEGVFTSLNNPGGVVSGAGTGTISIAKADIGSGVIQNIFIDGLSIPDVEVDFVTDTDLSGLGGLFSIQTQGDISQVAGSELDFADAFFTGQDVRLTNSGNDFQATVSAIGDTVELVDANDLNVSNVTAQDDIRLEAGASGLGTLTLNTDLMTNPNGQTLLQASNGVIQVAGVIETGDLLLQDTSTGTSNDSFLLNAANRVDRLSADIQGELQLINSQSLEFDSLTYASVSSTSVALPGVEVGSLQLSVDGDLTDALATRTSIETSADLDVTGDIVLGDGSATLEFETHDVGDLLGGQLVAPASLSIQAGGSATLNVDSTVILSDVAVPVALEVNATGDILQTLLPDGPDADAIPDTGTIQAPVAVLTSAQSIQLVQTDFSQLAAQATSSTSALISPFVINPNIANTFTGSLADNFTTDLDSDGDGVFEVFRDDEAGVNTEFTASDFAAGNHQFLNTSDIGVIVGNVSELDVTEVNGVSGVVSVGDVYIETTAGNDLNVLEDIFVIDPNSNITLIAGETFSLDAELRRASAAVINTVTTELELINPRSVASIGSDVFSDSQSQVDPTVGFATFDFEVGNPGEFSFNVLVGFLIEGIDAIDSITAGVQQGLIQEPFFTTGQFFLSDPTPDGLPSMLVIPDFDGFSETVDAFALRQSAGLFSLQNIDQFDAQLLAPRGFALSQIYVTNDAKINIFQDSGNFDLNFATDVIATRTVVENPAIIMVARPVFDIPSPPDAMDGSGTGVVAFVSYDGSDPIATREQPESYFLVKFTEDDDGVFEEEFRWDGDEDPDAIRAIIEDAPLTFGDWPDTANEDGNWTDRIRSDSAKPGLYFIFEVQEGEELPRPVDEPIDRTDLDSLRDSDESLNVPDAVPNDQPPSPDAAQSPSFTDNALEKDSLHSAAANLSLASAIALSQLNASRESSAGTAKLAGEDSKASGSANMFGRRQRMRRRLNKSFNDR